MKPAVDDIHCAGCLVKERRVAELKDEIRRHEEVFQFSANKIAALKRENERLKILQRPDGWHERVIANYYISDELKELLHLTIDVVENGEFVVFSIYEPDSSLLISEEQKR